MKRTIAWILAAMLLLAMLPGAAFADGEEPTPSEEPTNTEQPSDTPTADPTETPTTPVETPTATPTAEPTATPTVEPTTAPTAEPTATPTAEPTATPTPKTVDTVTIVNCKSAVNVRKGASSSTTKLGLAKKGTTYVLLGVEGKWYKIQYKTNTVGYVYVDYVKQGKTTETDSQPTAAPSEQPTDEKSFVKIVNCNTAVNVRKGAGSNTVKLGTAPKNATYKYLGKSGNWYKIQYTDKTEGYVFYKYVKFTSDSTTTPAEPLNRIVTVVNCNTAVNVRKGAGTNTTKIGIAPKGKQYLYLGASGDWYKIQYTDKTVGYIHKGYSKLTTGTVTPDKESEASGKTGTIVNCKSAVNVRQKASSSSKLLGTLKKGATITVLEVQGDWTKVQYNGKTAYIFSKYVKVG